MHRQDIRRLRLLKVSALHCAERKKIYRISQRKISALLWIDQAIEENACDYEKLNALCQEREQAHQELDALYERWSALAEEVEG